MTLLQPFNEPPFFALLWMAQCVVPQDPFEVSNAESMETMGLHISVCFEEAPSLSCYSEHSDQKSGSIGSMHAMEEDRTILFVIDERQKLVDYFGSRYVPIVQRDADESHTFVLYSGFLWPDQFMAPPQTHNRLYTKFG